MTATQVYWIMQLDSIQALFCFIGVISGVIAVACGIGYMWCYDDDMEGHEATLFKKSALTVLPIFITVILCGTFVPSTKTAVAMYIIPKITKSATWQTLDVEAAETVKFLLNEVRSRSKEERK